MTTRDTKHWLDYSRLIGEIVKYEPARPSRLGLMQERLGLQVHFPAGQLFHRPGLARKLGWVEALQVVGGVWNDLQLKQAAPKMRYEYGITHAYGMRLANQFPWVIEQLQDNPNTRRALLFIGKPEDGYEREKPCITSYQLIHRDGKLHLLASIRSWDLVSGFPYDTMVMGLVCQAMAAALGWQPGDVIATAASGHVYMNDVNDGRLPSEKRGTVLAFQLQKQGDWTAQVGWARQQLSLFEKLEWIEPHPNFIELEEIPC